ncbi:unnamed protein product [Lathyrus sativus]|nr:unnamed protein product [Lathyrus sativus]
MVNMERMNSDDGSSIRRRSLSLSSHISHHTDNDVDCESVSEAGDIGDRALPSRRFSESNSFHSENGSTVITNSSVRPFPQELSSTPHLSFDATVGSHDSKLVLIRYLLQKLFGPGVANVTSNHIILYLDLPSNMVCPLKQYGNNILKSTIYIKFTISIAFMTKGKRLTPSVDGYKLEFSKF